jgi:L-histidine N-alpha-methyltransferase
MDSTAFNPRIRIDTQLDPGRDLADLEELRRGLSAAPRQLPSKHFYDARGSALFEQITLLPEYYPTRAERDLLCEIADEISRLTAAEELVELGAGAATKTRLLLDAMQRTGRLKLFVPFDVSETTVRRVAQELAAEYDELEIHGIVADFVHHLSTIPPGSPRLVILLGGTIGNYTPGQAIGLLSRLAGRMAAGDYFLLGTDLIKDRALIERAYNDSQGVTAEFNRNILRVVNRLVDGTFVPELYEHLAFYDDRLERIEMYLVATEDHAVELPGLRMKIELAAGERIRTEISCKYDRQRVDSILEASGFALERWFTDDERLFGLALARRL